MEHVRGTENIGTDDLPLVPGAVVLVLDTAYFSRRFRPTMDLGFAKAPGFAASVLQIWLFGDEDDDEYENDKQRMSRSSSLPG